MSKKYLYIALAGIIVVVGCLLFVTSSANQLPPTTVRPNAKPALASTGSEKPLKVNATPAQQAILTKAPSGDSSQPEATVAASVTPKTTTQVTKCDSPATAQKASNLTASLASTTGVQKLHGFISDTELKQGVLDNITGVLGQ